MMKQLIIFLMVCNIFAIDAFANTPVAAIESGESVADCFGATIGDVTSGSVNYRAIWNPITYKVVFEKNGEGVLGTMTDQMCQYDIEYTLNKNNYVRQDYDFAGWCRDNNYCVSGEVYSDEDSIKNLLNLPGTVKLYAQWVPACAAKLHIGNEEMCLYKVKVGGSEESSLAIRFNNKTYYTGMSKSDVNIRQDSTIKLRVKYGNDVYNLHDLTVK